MMNTLNYDADTCIMTKFFLLISGKWKPIILHLIRMDINRFGLLMKRMPGISKKVLTEQLRELEADQIIRRHVIVDKAPKVVVYTLTEKGASLRRLLDDIITWSMQHTESDIPKDLVEQIKRDFPEMGSKLPWLKSTNDQFLQPDQK